MISKFVLLIILLSLSSFSIRAIEPKKLDDINGEPGYNYKCCNREEFTEDKNFITLENDTIKLTVNKGSGCFSIKEKISGKEWFPDPWENAAGIIELRYNDKLFSNINLSDCETISIERIQNNVIKIKFIHPRLVQTDQWLNEVEIHTSLHLSESKARLTVNIEQIISPPGVKLITLQYPARPFSLATEIDHGAAVIPHWQGCIIPSYIFPMNPGDFCRWDDAQQNGGVTGTIPYYGYGGLTMPWFGTYDKKSALMGILPEIPNGEMGYVINSNLQSKFNRLGELSPYKRILSVMPVWDLSDQSTKKEITYFFIPGGDYNDMAKLYRNVSRSRGYFKSLLEKVRENPEVEKLAGAMYIGIYGGYPHYINLESMAFTFDELKDMIRIIHDSLNISKAMIHAWGTYSNFPPNCWPVSEALGGPEKLKAAVDLAKSYGYLFAPYQTYIPALDHDPDFTTEYLPRNEKGDIILRDRWTRNDSKFFKELCQKNLGNELSLIGQNAQITDISFAHIPGNEREGSIELAKYIRSHHLVMGCERGEEYFIPYMDMFEGMDAYKMINSSLPAPLFNLVYHDAVATYGKIQDNDLRNSEYGDFTTKILRKMLYGSGSTLIFSPFQFDGIKPLIKMAYNALSELHEDVFYAELLKHEFLSPDFLLQRTEFSNGAVVIANMAHVAHSLPDHEIIPGYSYIIKYSNGKVVKGLFSIGLTQKEKVYQQNK